MRMERLLLRLLKVGLLHLVRRALGMGLGLLLALLLLRVLGLGVAGLAPVDDVALVDALELLHPLLLGHLIQLVLGTRRESLEYWQHITIAIGSE